MALPCGEGRTPAAGELGVPLLKYRERLESSVLYKKSSSLVLRSRTTVPDPKGQAAPKELSPLASPHPYQL